MSLFSLRSALLTAAVAVTSVQASPFAGLDTRSFNGLMARDFSAEECRDFVYGANSVKAGKVCYTLNGESLTITYPALSSPAAYEDLHVTVSKSPITETVVGQWPYTFKKGFCNLGAGTCTIKVQDEWKCGQTLYIGVHAGYTPDGTNHETGWMTGPCIEADRKGNCPKSTTIDKPGCKCPVVTKYEPIVESVVYKKTIIETKTEYCTKTFADVATKTICDNPKVAPTETVYAKTEDASFTCPTPV